MTEETARLLEQGIAAARAGDKATARRLLVEVTGRDERNEQAWFWLSGVVEDLEETRICLENVLAINPANDKARQGLAWVERRLAEQGPPVFGAAPSAPTPSPPPAARVPTPPPIEEQIVAAPPLPPAAAEEEAQVSANRVPCPACGALNFDFATECVKCSFPFAITCTSCGELVSTETGLCPHCDAELPLPQKLTTVRERETQIDEAYRQGLAYMEEKRYQEAKVNFEEVLTRVPDHIEARYNLGMVCARLGLNDEARQHWQEVQARQPDYPDIQKDLDSLLSPRDRRLLAKERKRVAPRPKKKGEAERKPAGQTLVATFEPAKEEEGPAPEEEQGGVESFLYVLVVGLVVGIAYALNPAAIPVSTVLDTARIVAIAKQAGIIAVGAILFWIVLFIAARLLSLVFRGRGKIGGSIACASRFLMPFFLLILPIVLRIPPVLSVLPEIVRSWVEKPLEIAGRQFPPLVWLVCGGIALFWGLFSLARGLGRVGRMALWKGFLVGLVAVAIAGGAIYALYFLVDQQGYLRLLERQVDNLLPVPSPAPTPGTTLAPTPPVTPAPTSPVTPVVTPVPTP